MGIDRTSDSKIVGNMVRGSSGLVPKNGYRVNALKHTKTTFSARCTRNTYNEIVENMINLTLFTTVASSLSV